MERLTSDFVHRRNMRVTLAKSDDSSDAFLISTYGSHHVFLVDYNAGLHNRLASRFRQTIRPRFPDIQSDEEFGIVKSATILSGNFIKEEETTAAEEAALAEFYGEHDIDIDEQLDIEVGIAWPPVSADHISASLVSGMYDYALCPYDIYLNLCL
jgi:hypothetical protein